MSERRSQWPSIDKEGLHRADNFRAKDLQLINLPLNPSPNSTELTIICPEPEFANLLKSPWIDSEPGGPVRQPYLTYRPARLNRMAESIPGLLKNLKIRAHKRGGWYTLQSALRVQDFGVFSMNNTGRNCPEMRQSQNLLMSLFCREKF